MWGHGRGRLTKALGLASRVSGLELGAKHPQTNWYFVGLHRGYIGVLGYRVYMFWVYSLAATHPISDSAQET